MAGRLFDGDRDHRLFLRDHPAVDPLAVHEEGRRIVAGLARDGISLRDEPVGTADAHVRKDLTRRIRGRLDGSVLFFHARDASALCPQPGVPTVRRFLFRQTVVAPDAPEVGHGGLVVPEQIGVADGIAVPIDDFKVKRLADEWRVRHHRP